MLTLATAWARVEGNRHYPADGLAGMALGNIMGAFFTEAFLGLDRQSGMRVIVEPGTKGIFLQMSWGFQFDQLNEQIGVTIHLLKTKTLNPQEMPASSPTRETAED